MKLRISKIELNRPDLAFDLDCSMFTSIFILGSTLFNYLSSIGFVIIRYDLFTICGIGLLLANFSLLYKVIFNLEDKVGVDSIRTILLFLLLIVLSFLPKGVSIILSFILALCGFCGFFLLAILPEKKGAIGQLLIWIIFPILLLTWITGFMYKSGFHHPLYLEIMSLGGIHIDQLFHASISQMINTYGVSSTGLQGIPYLSYHFGSHFLLGRFSEFLGIHVLKSYNFVYPIIFISLYLRVSFFVIKDLTKIIYQQSESLRSDVVFWSFFLILHIGFLPNDLTYQNWAIWDSWMVSESYLCSLLFLFAGISTGCAIVNVEKSKTTAIAYSILLWLIFCLVGFSKISVIFVAVGALFYMLLRSGKWKSPIILFNGIALLLIAYIVIKFTSPIAITAKGPSVFKDFHLLYFVKTWSTEGWRALFVPMFYLYFIIYASIRLASKGSSTDLMTVYKSKTFLDLEFIFMLALMGFIPSATLMIAGGGAYYFADLQTRFALVFLMAWTLNKRTQDLIPGQHQPGVGAFVRKNVFIVLIAIIICLNNVYAKFEDIVNKNLTLRAAMLRLNPVRSKYFSRGYSGIYDYLSGDPLLAGEKIKELAYLPGLVIARHQPYRFYSWLLDTCQKLPSKNEYYLWVSRTAAWGHYNEDAIPFILPAITGMAQANGLPKNYKKLVDYGYSGYHYLTRDSLECVEKREKKMLLVKPYELSLHECP